MNCPKCGFKIPMRAEHCYNCGNAITRNFDELAGVMQDEKAGERGDQIAGYFRVALVLLVIAAVILYAVNDYFDTPITYNPSLLPAIPATGSAGLEIPNRRKPTVEPNSDPQFAKASITAFGYRIDPIRTQLREANNGETPGAPTRARIQGALQFLGTCQLPDGSWPVQVFPRATNQWRTGEWPAGKVGVTALATLAYLGEGITWTPDAAGSKHMHGMRVQRAVQWLAKQQDAEGHFGNPGEDKLNFIYNHAIATMALVEAAGLTGDDHLRVPAQKGIDLLVKSQNEKGGWDYFGKPGANDGNAYVSLWPVLALAEASEAGFTVPEAVLQKAQNYFRALTQPDGRVQFGPGAADDGQFRAGLSANALLVRGLMGEDPRAGGLTPLLTRLRAEMKPVRKEWGLGWAPGRANNDDDKRAFVDPYFLFSATHAMYCMGGADWEAWNTYMKQSLADMQDVDNAWRFNDPFTKFGGTVYSTALGVLTLQVYYRFPSAASKTRGGLGGGIE